MKDVSHVSEKWCWVGHRTVKIKSVYLGLIIVTQMHKSLQHDAHTDGVGAWLGSICQVHLLNSFSHTSLDTTC